MTPAKAGCLSLMMLIGLSSQAFSSSIGLEVSGLNAEGTSIILPGSGLPTGPISASLNGIRTGTLDQVTGEGIIFYPTEISFPLSPSPFEATLVGPFFTSVPDSVLISFDMGFISSPLLGRVVISNNNSDTKNVAALLTGGPGTTVNGVFSDLSLAQYDSLERGRLRGMMDIALAQLQALDPSVPAISASVLDIIKGMYDSSPATELILYFPDAAPGDQFRTSELTGSDSLTLVPTSPAVPEPATLTLVAVGLLGAGVRRRRRRPQA